MAEKHCSGKPAWSLLQQQRSASMSQILPVFDIDACRGGDGYWYLASPYSKYPDGIHAAFYEICRCSAWLVRQGVNIYSPIAHTHPIAVWGNIDPLDHAIWLPADKPLMQGARGLIVALMPTWQDSYGIGVEIREFADAEKPSYGLDWPRT